MKKRQILQAAISGILLLAMLAGCASDQGGTAGSTPPQGGDASQAPGGTTQSGGETKTYGFATGGTGGTYYVIGGAISSLVDEKLPGMKMLVATSSSSMENVRLLHNRETDFAICRPDNVSYAFRGEREFTPETKIDDLRAIMLGHEANVQLVVLADSGIEKIEDLRGKRVALATKSSPAVYIALAVLEAHGITIDDIKPEYLTLAETTDSLKSGAIDCGFYITAAPTSAVLDLAATFDIRVLPFEESAIDTMLESYPFAVKGTMPANTYPGQTEDIWQPKDPCILMTHVDMDEQVVYDLLKTICENNEYLASVHQAGAQWDLETAVEGLGDIPLHPGAERYLKEQGIIS